MVKKMNLKKKLMALIAVVIMIFSLAPMAFAEPDENGVEQGQAQTDQIQTESQPVQTVQTAQLTNDKYLTKGGAAIWFILILLANGAFSFWVGNRFYRLSKKDNHIGAEIRALRRDIDDKFTKSVDGFAEQEISIENLNEALGINIDRASEPKKSTVKELSPEEEERFRRWEEAQSKPRGERVRHTRTSLREELEEDFDDVKTITKKNYKPRRDDAETEDKSDDLGETRVIKPMGEGVKNKAKEILGDIFPFKDE